MYVERVVIQLIGDSTMALGGGGSSTQGTLCLFVKEVIINGDS